MKQLTADFCQRALASTAGLSAGERADYFDFAQSIFHLMGMHQMAKAAADVAHDLREAEASQLNFQALLSSVQN